MSDAFTSSPEPRADARFAGPQARPPGARPAQAYAALDLGTNNCRLLIARPTADGFRVIDAFSRIVRLGEGLSLTSRLSEPAIARTLEALRICRDKIAARGVTRVRAIATEACRAAANGAEFVDEVRDRLGIELEVVDHETEAHLAAAGVGDLADRDARSIVMFDIGGGSSEIIWLAAEERSRRGRVRAWELMRLGVVSLAEKFGGVDVTDDDLRGDDGRCGRRARALRRPGGGPEALRPLPSARHLGHGHDHRRRAPQSAALRPARGRRALARPQPRSTTRSRGSAR